jgi:hypothetical protein
MGNKCHGTGVPPAGQMKFAITHPMHSHPYNPELVDGAGIAAVACAPRPPDSADSASPIALR